MKQETSAGIVVYRIHNNQPEYLLLHYEAGHWDLPKGHIEAHETLEETALRELQEEAGIQATIIPGFEEQFSYVFKKDNLTISKKVHFFLGKATSDQIILSHEHQDYAWLPYNKALERLTYDNAKKLLTKAQAYLEKVAA